MTISGLERGFRQSRCVRRSRAPRRNGAARRRRSRPAPDSSPRPFGVSTSMRRRCGCTARSAMVLTSAKAMSASASRFNSSSRVSVAKLSPTVLSVSRAVADALDHVGKARIVRQVGLAQHVGAELLPLALALDRNQDVLAVLGAEHAIGRDRGMGEAHPLRRIAGFRIEQRHRQPVGHHVEHRNPDVGALAGACARDQRFEDRGMRGGAGGDIDDRHADARGPSGPPVIEASPLSAWISRS